MKFLATLFAVVLAGCAVDPADETLIVLQGTSSMVYEETRIKFMGDQMTDLRRYAEKGPGMGEGAPGQVPQYREYPPR